MVHRCGRCRGSKNVKPRHCYVKADGTPMITCNDKECQCKCKTHYICKECGRLAPYDQKVKHVCLEKTWQITPPKLTKKDKELESEIQVMMSKWRSTQKEVELTYKESKN